MRRFEETVAELEETAPVSEGGEPNAERIELLREAWRTLDEHLDRTVDDVESAQEVLPDDAPSIEEFLHTGLRTFERTLHLEIDIARHGADWTSKVLDRFSEESEAFRARVSARRAECLQYAKRWSELESVARTVIEHEPDEPRGYALLSDALLEKSYPQPQKAVEVLEDALERLVRDPKSWDLEKRLEDAREAVESDETGTKPSDETRTLDEAWDDFWDDFGTRDVEGKFQLARQTIDDEPHFDGRWAFDMMIEGLLAPAREHDRGDDWVSIVEHLRERRPDVAREESGYLAMHEMQFRLWSGDEDLEETFEFLLSAPTDQVDLVFDTLYLAAYFGELATAAEYMHDGWADLQNHGDKLRSNAYEGWAEWALRAVVSRWADRSIETSRSIAEIEETLDEMADPLDPEAMEAFGESFLGPYDEEAFVARLEEPVDEEEVTPIASRFARLLVERHDWAPSKALLTVTPLHWLWSEQRSSGHPAQSRYAANRGSNLRKLRERLEDEHWMLPDPGLVDGIADEASTMTPMGTPHPAAAFMEAISHVSAWLKEVGLAEGSRVLESLSRHLKRRIEHHADHIGGWDSVDPSLERNLQRAIERLE